MITVQKLQQAIAESQSLPPTPSIPRDNYLAWLQRARNSRLIKAIVGFRRSGKSYLLKLLTKSLIQKGIPAANIFYLNFENDLLAEVKKASSLRALWEIYLAEIADLQRPIYLIWDEIQLVDQWEKLVRSLYEQGKYNIFLSGSNSQLLSGEFSSSLSGRSLQLEVQPFSFREYLSYRGLAKLPYYHHKAEIDQAFMVYLRRGGLAEQFGLDETLAQNYAAGLIQKIILDDIVKRYQIDKVNVLQQALDFVRGNITSTLSLRKIIVRLTEQGLSISPTTLDNYLYYWQTAYAIDRVSKFDYRLSQVFDRTAKYYCADNLLISGRQEADEKRLENLVYNELIRRYGRGQVYFAQDANGYEIDFLVKHQSKLLFFQVCWHLDDYNAKRELGNLELVNKYLQGKGVALVLQDGRSSVAVPPGLSVQSVIEWLQ
jgi:predicted AAA+ superfamily ATPase